MKILTSDQIAAIEEQYINKVVKCQKAIYKDSSLLGGTWANTGETVKLKTIEISDLGIDTGRTGWQVVIRIVALRFGIVERSYIVLHKTFNSAIEIENYLSSLFIIIK